MTLNQAKSINANKAFQYWQAPVGLVANDEQFALAA